MPVSRFPLRPGRPAVFRRANGGWGWICCCGAASRTGCTRAERHNAATHAEALRSALVHVAVQHKTLAELEVELLELTYQLPAHERTMP